MVQTPYSSVPQAPGLLERVAGATTDIQYLIPQGFTAYQATFWVGANALLRTEALEDIRTEEEERGFIVRRYIQDRTVIEDTESSIDLVVRGWSLYNYPERLSYSATPPDFGSLVIQRHRWANGGLLILPKLLRHLPSRRLTGRCVAEVLMRFHYLGSVLAVNLGVLILLTYPFERALRIAWLPLTALPYYALYGWDLVLAGYRWSDLYRVYALNLLLIPVNLAGVGKSLVQGLTGQKSPFSRTPKIAGKTLAPVSIVAAEVVLTAYCLFGVLLDTVYHRWWHASFALLNASILAYATDRFIGIADVQQQLATAVRAWLLPIRRLWYHSTGQLRKER